MSQAKLERFFEINQQLTALKQEEAQLRKELFGEYFPEAVEGAGNKHDLGDGFILQATKVVNRTIDKAALQASGAALIEQGIPVDDLVNWKPELKKSNWNKLNDEQKHAFAIVVTERDGMPKLEIKKPKRG